MDMGEKSLVSPCHPVTGHAVTCITRVITIMALRRKVGKTQNYTVTLWIPSPHTTSDRHRALASAWVESDPLNYYHSCSSWR